MLRVDVTKQLGEFTLSASFISEGRVTGLFGASGAGKTSLVNMIAGLLRPDRGVIAIDDETLDDTAARIHVPPHRRRIGYVFQDARLFPHLRVAANLRYGEKRTAAMMKNTPVSAITAPRATPPNTPSFSTTERAPVGAPLMFISLRNSLVQPSRARKNPITTTTSPINPTSSRPPL